MEVSPCSSIESITNFLSLIYICLMAVEPIRSLFQKVEAESAGHSVPLTREYIQQQLEKMVRPIHLF